MNKKDKTRDVILILIIILGMWDLYCWWQQSDNWTVSQVMLNIGMSNPFVVGVLFMCLGHFFLPTKPQYCFKCKEKLHE